jgi:hypothetical protein
MMEFVCIQHLCLESSAFVTFGFISVLVEIDKTFSW